MSDTACRSDAPPPPPEIKQDVDIWNPGGDPGELRRAAQSWRTMADTVESVAANLDGAVRRCLAQWQGETSTAFAEEWDKVHAGMTAEVVPHLREIARKLDETADSIEDINDQIHDLYVSIGVAVGVGVVLSVVTLGFSAAASAAAAAAAGARAGLLVARMAAILKTVATALRSAKLASHYAKAWGTAAAVNTTATGVSKAITNPNHNPFDGWRLDDAAAVVNGSTAAGLTAGAGTGFLQAGRLGVLGQTAARHPLAAGGVMGGAGNAGGSVLNDVIGGESIDWSDAGLSGAGGFAGGAAGSGISRGIARLRAKPAPAAPLPALSPGRPDVDRLAPPFVQRPSGLYVPGSAPQGFVRRPDGLVVPEPVPAGWHSSPSGLIAPGPPPPPVAPVAPVVAASGWDELLGGLLGEAPPVGVANSRTSDSLNGRPGASTPAPVCVSAGP